MLKGVLEESGNQSQKHAGRSREARQQESGTCRAGVGKESGQESGEKRPEHARASCKFT